VHGPADLAAVTLSAPPVSDDAPRTTFGRIRGRPGRHQADLAPTPNGQLPNGQATGLAPGSQAINGEAQPAAPVGGHALPQADGYAATQTSGYAAATQASAQPQPRAARHAHGGNRQETASRQESASRQETGSRQEAGNRHASFFSRPPMAPLTTPGPPAPAEAGPSEAHLSEAHPSEARPSEAGPPEAGPPGQEDAEDTGWGATAWDRQGPAGSMGSRRSGGG